MLPGAVGRLVSKAVNFVRGAILEPLGLARIIRRERIALVHLNNSIVRNHSWMIAARIAGARCITHERGINPQFRRRDRNLARRLDAIICISAAVRDNFAALGLADLPLVTIHNGLNPAQMRVTRSPAQVRAELHVAEHAEVVGIVGNIKPWKGQEVVIRALAQLREEFPDLMCLLIGDTSPDDAHYRTQVEELVRQLGLPARVFITGYRDDVASYIAALDIMIHASVAPEPFGRVLLEGMALSKPLVASNGGAVPEIVLHEKTGLLFEPGQPQALADALRKLLRDPARASALGAGLVILEAEPAPGGKLRTEEVGGFRFEAGANGFLTNKPDSLRLVEDSGAAQYLLPSSELARKRYIYTDRLHRMPESPPLFAKSKLLTWPQKLRILGEFFVPPRRDGADETLREFGDRRLGHAFTSVFLDAMSAGIYGSTPEKISVQAAFPLVVALEREHGGLFRGMVARRRKDAGPGGVLTSTTGGIGTLVRHLHGVIDAEWRVREPVRSVERAGSGFRIHTAGGTTEVDRVVICATSYAAADMVQALDAELASDFVLFEQRGGVAIVTINRPDRMNALGHEVRTGLVDAFLKIRHDPSIRVAVITGAGDKAFSAGADLKEHNEIFQKKSYRVGRIMARSMNRRTLANWPSKRINRLSRR